MLLCGSVRQNKPEEETLFPFFTRLDMTFICFPWLLGFPRMFDPNLLMKHISFSGLSDMVPSPVHVS